MMKLVSIIVPVYNRNKVILKCYKSLINQTYKNIEIIFVDYGSSDGTLDILNSFNDDRVLVFSKENDVLSDAIKYGFNKSHGEYICFVGSDDTLNKDFISKLVMSLERDGSSIAIGRLSIHYCCPIIKKISLKVRKRIKIIDLEQRKEFLPILTPEIVGKLFKRELLNLEKLDFRVNEDISIMYPMYVKSRYISICNDCVYHYQLSENSQFKEYIPGYNFNNLLNTFEPLKKIYDEFIKMDKLEDYFYEIEMLFIKNISVRIWNIIQSVNDKIYRYKFICVILDYLECFFPDWDSNPYYNMGFNLGEISDLFYVRRAYREIKKIKRKKLCLSLDEVYKKYRQVEDMYNRSK